MATEGIRQWYSRLVAALARTPRYDAGQLGEEDEEVQLNRMDFKRWEYETGDETPSKRKRSWPWILLLLAAAVGTLSLLTYAFSRRSACHVSPTRHQPSHLSPTITHGHGHMEDHRPSHQGQVKECGTVPEEAQVRGCVFEQQLAAWVPKACGFPDVVDEYMDNFGDMMAEWTWYWDRNTTMEVPPERVPDLQAGNFSVIYTRYQASHDLHCLYCSRKIIYALSRGITMMDARCHQFYHGAHCVQHIGNSLIMAERGEKKKMQTWVYPLMYHNCVPLTSTRES
ncbi:hypothetical protein QBC32DRAFT_379242 [Pseudoneurospora amorphoporcata]|uniref:Uncharacterized protein n=1 Tax=Pseudoneurospora amorphoporcata TaxID=241081 RepID=A0AAN6NNQ7_9PEZI|nr:hypothetical protein QBC32DRAFT_379242 [Pseudoneurospora amorphoporcata]